VLLKGVNTMNYKPLTADEIYPLYSEPLGEHVAYAEDGVLHWMSGRKFQNCELYIHTSPVSPTEAPKPARSDPVSLHSAIMNLPLKPYDDKTTYYAYIRGHQDARHAAADLVDAYPQQPARELLVQVLAALECASNGLLWYADMAPEHVDGSDGEVAEQIDSAITALHAALEKP
jgi:hypothetical protein